MGQKEATRGEVIVVGLGGGGIKLFGDMLVSAIASRYKHVTGVPFYAIAKRGGVSEYTVIFSDEEINSPLLTKSKTVIMLDSSQLKSFESRVCPGGLLILERESLKTPVERKDIKVMTIPAVETALKLGSSLAANFVMMGAYVGGAKTVKPELIEQELDKKFAGNEKALSLNKEAFRQGLKLATGG